MIRGDLDELRDFLTAEIERLAEALLGKPTEFRNGRRKARWGDNGSLEVVLQGSKRGLWVKRQGGGGGPFELIMFALGCNFTEALTWARTWTNTELMAATPRPVRPGEAEREARAKAAEREQLADDAAAIRRAQGFAREAVPIAGTVGENYLTEARRIPAQQAWPECIRFHHPSCSVVVVATTPDGEVRASQCIYLTSSGQKLCPDDVAARRLPNVKSTYGRAAGAVVRLPARADVAPALASVLLLAEGPENGLSVWAATGCETLVAFGVGQFQHIELASGRRTILCRDDDREHSPADKAVRKAVTIWRKAGADLVVATPWETRRQNKSDFNDLLREKGAHGVLLRLLPLAPPPNIKPPVRMPVADARERVDAAVREFFEAAAAFDPDVAKAEGALPPVHGLKVGVGIGKSFSARKYAVDMVIKLRRQGSRQNVALAVPLHRLAAEQAELMEALPAFRAARLKVSVWRGRSAPDPAHSDFADPSVPDESKTAMCRNLEAVYDAQDHALNVQESACRRSIPQGTGERVVYECPHFAECPYQAQRKRQADLWIVPHEMLYLGKPTALGKLAAVVVDESAWQAGLEGVTGRGDRMPLDALRGDDKRFQDERSPDWLTLQDYRTRILAGLDCLTDGPITREAILAEGFVAGEAADARRLELNRKTDPKIHPGLSRADRLAALKAAQHNRSAMQLARFWGAIEALITDGGPAASGWAELATIETPDGPARVVRLRGRKPIRDGWSAPTVLIDALLDPELVRPWWPQIEVVADVQAETPHQRIRQVIDRAYSKNRLDPLDAEKAETDPEEARRRTKALREARAIIAAEARRHRGGKIFVAAQKGVRGALEALGSIPRNVMFGHHNGVAGMDQWGDVGCLILVGRTAPPPVQVERMVESICGAAIAPVEGWYPKQPVSREMAGGEHMAAEADRHPHPLCEAVRWQVCEGQLIQVVGRGRGANRTASNSIDVLIMTDVPLPMPLDEALSAADLAPTIQDRMLAECGFAFDNPTDAADACPGIWPTRNAAKMAMKAEAARKGKLGSNPYEYIYIGERPQLPPELRRVDYQRQGQGKSAATAWFDPLVVDDPELALVGVLGPLARFHCEQAGEAIGVEKRTIIQHSPGPVAPPRGRLPAPV